jgi:WD40 repeat protein
VIVLAGVLSIVELIAMQWQASGLMEQFADNMAKLGRRDQPEAPIVRNDKQALPLAEDSEPAVVLTVSAQQGRHCCLAFSPDGKHLASGGRDSVIIWETSTGKIVHRLRGHQGEVYGLAYSLDGGRLASAGGDRTAKVWNTATGRELFTSQGHAGPLRGVAFSRDGKFLATASDDHTVRLWDAAGKAIQTIAVHTEAVHAVAFSPDSRRLAMAGAEGQLLVWDLGKGQVVRTIRRPLGSMQSVAFSPDGQRLATSGTKWVANRLQGEAVIWDSTTGKEVLNHSLALPVGAVAYSPDGRGLLGVGGLAALLWEADSRKQVLDLQSTSPYAPGAAFGHDSRSLALADWEGKVKIWKLPVQPSEPHARNGKPNPNSP